MNLKERKKPKVQRGISLTPELNETIGEVADKFGMTWNEAAERALAKAFLSPPSDCRNPADDSRNAHDGGSDIADLIQDETE